MIKNAFYLQPGKMLNYTVDNIKGETKKNSPAKISRNSGGRTVCPRRLSFSPFVVLMSTTNGEKDNLLGQTILRQELGEILDGLVFFRTTLYWGTGDQELSS